MDKLFIQISIILAYYVLGAYSTTDYLRLTSYGEVNPDIQVSDCLCPKCGHKLKISDQVPIFSYLFHKGKCAYCNSQIPKTEFILELGISLSCLLITLFGNFNTTSFVICLIVYEASKIIVIFLLKPKKRGFKKTLVLSFLLNIPIFGLIYILYLFNQFII